MTRSAVAGARFRQRKLSTKQGLSILRENQIDQVDDDAHRNITKVETGVEKGELDVSHPCVSVF
jgi:enhancer of polycomb-like protein